MRPIAVALSMLSLLSWSASAHADVLRSLSYRDRLYDAASVAGTLFVVGHPGRVLRSSDGGATFESLPIAKHEEALFSISFNTKGEGAIVGRSGFVLLSSDKGKTWTSTTVTFDGEKPSLFGVDVLEDGAIVAVGNFGVIVRSEDHGKTWSKSSYSSALPTVEPGQPSACGESEGESSESENEGAIDEARLSDVSFSDSTHGYAVGEFGLVVRTEDGGRTFKRQNSCSGVQLYGVSMTSETHALAVGADGTAIETEDGGARWTVRATGTTEHLFGLASGAKQTLVVGAAGTVLVRATGNAFQSVPSDVHTWLASAALDDKGKGVIVGGRAFILRTEDSGKTQQRISGE